jgi:nitroimidazol reductase NimA-like FMN-containing flavoprotein (pyridoxamine 5'-phosphate oxidase superfamily)
MQAPSIRSQVKRNAGRAEYDPHVLRNILDGEQIRHVAYADDSEPRLIAKLYMCDGDYLYLHGDRQSMAVAKVRCLNISQKVLRHVCRSWE